MNLILLVLAGIFVNNYVMSQFLGICPFLGVSKKVDTAAGMGMAVIFVMVTSRLSMRPWQQQQHGWYTT